MQLVTSRFRLVIRHLSLRLWNAPLDIVTDNQRLRPKNSEVNRLFGDNKRLSQLTGWYPAYGGLEGFRRGLEITAEWFTDPANLSRYSPGSYSV